MKGRRLYQIVDPSGIESVLLARDPVSALALFHIEAGCRVRVRDGQLIFRDAADQLECSGEWRVLELSVNDGSAATVFEITEPG